MRIVEIAALPNGAHRNQTGVQFTIPEGWAMIPEGMETPNFPFGQVTAADVNGVMTVTGWVAVELPGPTPEELAAQLQEAKDTAVTASKTDLADYLLAHPLQWTDGEYYAITAEKQSQLTSKIMAATLAAQSQTPYTLTWNSTGEVCKEWSLTDLSALAFAIDARVTSLVTYQQQKEVEIRNCETVEAVNAVVVDYDEVE